MAGAVGEESCLSLPGTAMHHAPAVGDAAHWGSRAREERGWWPHHVQGKAQGWMAETEVRAGES